MNLGLGMDKDDFFGGTKREVKEETELQDIVFGFQLELPEKFQPLSLFFKQGLNSSMKLLPSCWVFDRV